MAKKRMKNIDLFVSVFAAVWLLTNLILTLFVSISAGAFCNVIFFMVIVFLMLPFKCFGRLNEWFIKDVNFKKKKK